MQQDFGADGTFRRLDAELKKDEIKLEIWSTDMGILDVREEVGVKAGRGFEVFGERYITKDPKASGLRYFIYSLSNADPLIEI